jgi:hypothetical protein
MMNLLICSLLIVLPGQTPPKDGLPGTPATRLATMKKAMAAVEMRSAGPGGEPYRLKPEPVLRYTNTVGDSRDGAIFLWLGDGDRPEAAVQVFKTRYPWMQEWTSLSLAPLMAKMPDGPAWKPSRGGVELKPVSGAPKPADTASGRLRQMHTLASDFSARDRFRGVWQPLRMLSNPMARYGKPGSEAVDGALFAFVITTDPEAWLMLEARTTKNGLEWQYAFAPMSGYPLEASWKKQLVWSQAGLPQNRWDLPFYELVFEPKE